MTQTHLADDWPGRFGIRDPHPPWLFRGPEDLDRTPQPVGQAHGLRRAFEHMKLDAIWRPPTGGAVYFKIASRVEPDQLEGLHRSVWNQGLAPLLVVVGGQEVRIYSALSTPAPIGEPSGQDRGLVETLDLVADALELSRFALRVETGELFRCHAKAFNPDLRVDRRLLENLETARDQIRNASRQDSESPLPEHLSRTLDALLCRIVFTCYLVDRGIIDGQYFEQSGIPGATQLSHLFGDLDLPIVRRRLYSLFSCLQQDFNGDLFSADLEAEENLVEDSHLEVLGRFLCGEDLATGQLSFLDYDFSVIPIETISAIYERFLSDRRQTGAFFTPRILAEKVLDIATENADSLLDKRFLDPACGSGIFLVALFNRLAEEWRRHHQDARYDSRADALIGILKKNIFGIDNVETACRIAAFSLYLALLDHLDPPDIRRLQRRGRLLPPLVFGLDEAREQAGEWVILHSSFGQVDPVITLGGFDLIVGNPPWVSRQALDRVRDWPYDSAAEVPQGQLAYLFIHSAPRHLRNGGSVCFLLPYGVLFNHSAPSLRFQLLWFENNSIDRVFNLADLRYLIFGAVRPALIVTYHPRPSRPEAHLLGKDFVEYYTPKADWAILRADILDITDNHTTVDLRAVTRKLKREQAPTEWKVRLWGTSRDWKLLDRLSLLPTLGHVAGQPHKGLRKRWIVSQGFKPENPKKGSRAERPEPKPRPWPDEQLFLEGRSKAIDLLLSKGDCKPIGSRFLKLHRNPKASEIFDPPHVLVTQGLRVAYCDFKVVFQDSVQGFNGPSSDRRLLMFLAAFLSSPLARYYLFHTVANWGIERDKVHLEELLKVPFPLPEETADPEAARTIVRNVADLMNSGLKKIRSQRVDRSSVIESLYEEILPLIYQYYDIDDLEAILIEDTVCISEPSKMPKRRQRSLAPALKPTTREERAAYLSSLCNLINEWTSGGSYRIIGEVTISNTAGFGVVSLSRVASATPLPISVSEHESTEALDATLTRIRDLRLHYSGTELKVFDGPRLYLLKPLILRYWTRSAALNDADEIAASILSKENPG